MGNSPTGEGRGTIPAAPPLPKISKKAIKPRVAAASAPAKAVPEAPPLFDDPFAAPLPLGAPSYVVEPSRTSLAGLPSVNVSDDWTINELWTARNAHIKGLSRSTAGSGGVTFIVTTRGVLVLKSSSRSGQEMFGVRLGQRLRIPIADMRVMARNDGLWAAIKESIARVGNESDMMLLDRLLDYVILCMMEYVPPAVSFSDLGPKTAPQYFIDGRLRELGGLVACDVMMNNTDRIPIHIWRHTGNSNNLMLGARVTAIDNTCATLDPSLGSCVQYFNKVRRLAADIRTRRHNAACFSEIAEFIRICTGWSMGEDGRRHVYAGMIEVIRQGSTLTLEELQQMKMNVSRMVAPADDASGVWRDQMATIHPSFVYQAAQALAECFEAKDSSEVKDDDSCIDDATIAIQPASNQNLKIAICQVASFADVASSITWADNYLSSFTNSLSPSLNRRPDFMIFPEGFIPGHDYIVDMKQPHIAAFCALAQKHGVHFIMGSLNERDTTTGHTYVTSVLISDQGTILGRYRKQRHLGTSSAIATAATVAASEMGCFTTRFGVVAVLTCLDIEAIDVLERTLTTKPVLVFNPSCITPPSGTAATKEFIQSTWRMALDTTSRRFERLASKHSTTIIRTDQPLPIGLGTSLVVAPGHCEYVPHSGAHVWCTFVDVPATANSFWRTLKAADEIRQLTEDNTGSRYQSQLLHHGAHGYIPSAVSPVAVSSLVVDGSDHELFIVNGPDIQCWRVTPTGKRCIAIASHIPTTTPTAAPTTTNTPATATSVSTSTPSMTAPLIMWCVRRINNDAFITIAVTGPVLTIMQWPLIAADTRKPRPYDGTPMTLQPSSTTSLELPPNGDDVVSVNVLLDDHGGHIFIALRSGRLLVIDTVTYNVVQSTTLPFTADFIAPIQHIVADTTPGHVSMAASGRTGRVIDRPTSASSSGPAVASVPKSPISLPVPTRGIRAIICASRYGNASLLAESAEGYVIRRALHLGASNGDEKTQITCITAAIGLPVGGTIVVGYSNGHIRLLSAAIHSTGVTIAPLGLIAAHDACVRRVQLIWPSHMLSCGAATNDTIRLWTLSPLPSLLHSFHGDGHGVHTFVANNQPRTIWAIHNAPSSSSSSSKSSPLAAAATDVEASSLCVTYQFTYNRHMTQLSSLLT